MFLTPTLFYALVVVAVLAPLLFWAGFRREQRKKRAGMGALERRARAARRIAEELESAADLAVVTEDEHEIRLSGRAGLRGVSARVRLHELSFATIELFAPRVVPAGARLIERSETRMLFEGAMPPGEDVDGHFCIEGAPAAALSVAVRETLAAYAAPKRENESWSWIVVEPGRVTTFLPDVGATDALRDAIALAEALDAAAQPSATNP